MTETTTKNTITKIRFFLILFSSLSIIEGLFAFSFLLMIQADPENQIFMGLSAKRLMLASVNLFLVLFLCVFLLTILKNIKISERISNILPSPLIAFSSFILLLISIAGILWSFFPISPTQQAYTERLRPMMIWVALIGIQLIILQQNTCKEELSAYWNESIQNLKHKEENIAGWIQSLGKIFKHPVIDILFVLLISAPLLLQNAVRYDFPIGVAGLYTLMAEQVAESHFLMPFEIPFYGPGGIPFAYPPFSFYAMAFSTDVLGIQIMNYLRFAAPFFSLLALIPMYLLTKEISGNRITATVSSFLLATYSRIYLIHGQAAGMTRGLAFVLAISGIYYFYRALNRNERSSSILAGVFLGLTTMTHPTYVELFVISACVMVLVGTQTQKSNLSTRFIHGLFTASIGLVLSSPWWLTSYLRFGSDIFLFASDSHDSLNFLAILQNPAQVVPLFSDFLYKLNKTPLLAGPAILSFFWLLARKKFLLPLWSLVYIFIFGGYDFLIITVAGIMAAVFLVDIYDHIITQQNKINPARPSLSAPFFLFIILAASYYPAYRDISSYHPEISASTIELAEWFQAQTAEDATFVRLTSSSEEAEWYPYLLRRTPVISSWGAEWTGDYKNQFKAVNQLVSCSKNQSYECAIETLLNAGTIPDYAITDSSADGLNTSFEANEDWTQTHQNAGYIVWKKADSSQTIKE